MNWIIREIKKSEYSLLEDFLYEAIFIPNGSEPVSKKIINSSDLQVYIKHFGESESDKGLVAEIDGKVIGIVWVRIMNDYGHIDDETPSLAMSVYKAYRGLGIGTCLLKRLLLLLKENGYSGVSLSVQKENYAFKMYQKVGFTIFAEYDDEYIMSITL